MLTLQPPEQPATQTITDVSLIATYNNLLIMKSNFINDATLADLKQELVNRDIITNDHEGEVVI
jgi:hypothetical protein